MDRDSNGFSEILSKTGVVKEGLGEFLSMLEDSSLTTQFLPKLLMIVPQAYRTRQGIRVDVCGNVLEETVEYEQGYRFFSSAGELFCEDGRCHLDQNSPCDLIAVLTANDPLCQKPLITPYKWVHPQHVVSKAWFQNLVPGKLEAAQGKHYVNRIGLVIKLKPIAGDHPHLLTDDDGRVYTLDGVIADGQISMFDLTHEIKHWSVFSEQDWTNGKGVEKSSKTSYTPEMFDPTFSQENRQELLQQFFTAMAQVNELADKLGINLGFDMASRANSDFH